MTAWFEVLRYSSALTATAFEINGRPCWITDGAIGVIFFKLFYLTFFFNQKSLIEIKKPLLQVSSGQEAAKTSK